MGGVGRLWSDSGPMKIDVDGVGFWQALFLLQFTTSKWSLSGRWTKSFDEWLLFDTASQGVDHRKEVVVYGRHLCRWFCHTTFPSLKWSQDTSSSIKVVSGHRPSFLRSLHQRRRRIRLFSARVDHSRYVIWCNTGLFLLPITAFLCSN